MTGSFQTDLFATKGMEYLLVIGFLLFLVPFWRLLNSAVRRPVRVAQRPVLNPGSWFHLPAGLYHHPGHTWAVPDTMGLVKVGLDDFAQKLLGEPRALLLPEVGKRVGQGEPDLALEVASKKIHLLSPVDGEVVALNEAALQSPDLVNRDPYGEGWLMKVRPSRPGANFRGLLRGSLAAAWIGQTEDALRRRISGDLGVVLQDGGLPVSGIARSLSPEAWDEVAKEFLLTG